MLPPEFESRYLRHPARDLVTILTELLRLLLVVVKMKTERQDCQIVFTAVRDRIPVGTRFSARPDRPWGPPRFL